MAIVESKQIEPLIRPDQVTLENQSKYWRVNAPETLETAIRNQIQNQMIEVGDSIVRKLKMDEKPINEDILIKIREMIALPDNFNIDIKPSLKGQPFLSSASGCLIGRDHVLSCGHLDDDKTYARFLSDPSSCRILFNYRADDVKHNKALPAWQVRDIES